MACLFTRSNGSKPPWRSVWLVAEYSEEQPDDRQRDRDHDQEPVDVADRPPLLRERAPRDEVHISDPG